MKKKYISISICLILLFFAVSIVNEIWNNKQNVVFSDDLMGQVICINYGYNKTSETITNADIKSIKKLKIGFLTSFTTLRDIQKLKKLEELSLNIALIEGDSTGLQRIDANPKPTNEQIIKELTEILPKLSNLSYFVLANFEKNLYITDLDFLSRCINLEEIMISDTDITNLNSLKDLKKIKVLWVDKNKINDISSIKHMKNLTDIHMQFNNIKDISGLKDLDQLTFINLNDNLVEDITSIQNLNNLTMILLNNNNIANISPLQNLTNLRTVSLSGNNISDISPLLNLKNLKEIELKGNPVAEDEEQINKLREKFPDVTIII